AYRGGRLDAAHRPSGPGLPGRISLAKPQRIGTEVDLVEELVPVVGPHPDRTLLVLQRLEDVQAGGPPGGKHRGNDADDDRHHRKQDELSSWDLEADLVLA